MIDISFILTIFQSFKLCIVNATFYIVITGLTFIIKLEDMMI